MNRLQLRNRVRYFIDEPVEQNFTDSDINLALNIAQGQVQLEIIQATEDYFISPTPTTITLVAGTATYPLAADFFSIKRVEDGTTGLEILPFDLNEKSPQGTGFPSLVSSTPGNYYLVGSFIGFSPTPSATATVKYWHVPTLPDFTDDTTVSPIPSPYHDMIAVRAAVDSFIKDEADVTNLRTLWGEYLDRLKRTVKNRQIQRPSGVRRVSDNNSPYSGLM